MDDGRYRVKRPMNAFMLWSLGRRRLLLDWVPNVNNQEISQHLGDQWNALTEPEKRPYFAEAKRLKTAHMVEHPDYWLRFKPRTKYRLKKGAQSAAVLKGQAPSGALFSASTATAATVISHCSPTVNLYPPMSANVRQVLCDVGKRR